VKTYKEPESLKPNVEPKLFLLYMHDPIQIRSDIKVKLIDMIFPHIYVRKTEIVLLLFY